MSSELTRRHAPLCEVCGDPAPADQRCTNGRCGKCHAQHCTPGGATGPGHDRGTVATLVPVFCRWYAATDELGNCNSVSINRHNGVVITDSQPGRVIAIESQQLNALISALEAARAELMKRGVL